ncbi:sodium:galactoside symporter-like protein, partial [mine drainage metagenome]
MAPGFLLSGGIWAIIFFAPPLIVFFGIRERPFLTINSDYKGFSGALKKLFNVWKGVFGTLANKSFAILTVFYLLSWTAVQLVQNNLFLYSKYVLRQEFSFQWILLLLQLMAAASL